MASRVYIGRLSHRVRERDIERFFKNYGRVKEIMLKNGYGFVEFEDDRDADDAVYELNGRELCGDRVVVEHAKGTPHGRDAWKDRERGIDYSRRNNDRYEEPERNRTRYTHKCVLENLSSRATKHDVKDLLRKCGDIEHIEMHSDYAVIEFVSARDMKYAIDKFYGTEFFGRKIKLYEEKRESRSHKRSRSRSGSEPRRKRSDNNGRRSSSAKRSTSRGARHMDDDEDEQDHGDDNGRNKSSESHKSHSRSPTDAADHSRNNDDDDDEPDDEPSRRTNGGGAAHDNSDDDDDRRSADDDKRSGGSQSD